MNLKKNNMKKISILYFFSALLIFTSCEDPVTPDLGVDEQWLQFGQDEYTIAENSPDPLVVTVFYAADTNPNDITVDYTVTSGNPDRYELTPTTGTVTIPAGEFSADIIIDPVDNFTADGDGEIVLELASHPDYPIGLVGGETSGRMSTVTIIDDDCPVDIESFVGTYSVAEQFTSGVNAPFGLTDFFGESYQVDVSLAPGDATGTQLVLNNSAGFDPYFVNGTVITLRTCTATFTFNSGNPSLALFATLNVTATSFDENTLQITASGPLGGFGPYQFLLTKIESN